MRRKRAAVRTDTVLEVNVFSPCNLHSCSDMARVNFAAAVVQSIERKDQIAAELPGHCDTGRWR